MGAFEKEVASLVRERFGSVAELARITNLSEQTLHSLFNKGSFARSRTTTVAAIANALEVDATSLMRGQLVSASDRFRGFAEVPLFRRIPAGQTVDPSLTDERFPISYELIERYPGCYLLRISGTSMNRILPDGCYALVEPCCEVQYSGQPYALTVGQSDATVKRVAVLGNGLELMPDSTDITWRSAVFDFAENDGEIVAILGRVVWFCVPFNWRF